MTLLDAEMRSAAFAYLEQVVHHVHRTISWEQMKAGFPFQGRRWPLFGPQGIYTPKGQDLPLSILTAPVRENVARKYEDSLSRDGFLVYKYRGTNVQHRDNIGLRRCIASGLPLIYFFGLVPSIYEVLWPVRVLKDEPQQLQFLLSIEEGLNLEPGTGGVADSLIAQRAYKTRTVYQRMHQDSFRRRVLAAYATRCTVCNLRHEELLQAAHIIPDSEPRGDPVVVNGMAMCNLHHAAFDAGVMGIRPDLVIEVRKDVLEEKDGPMLEHGLQGFHGLTAKPPRSRSLWPSKDRLEERYSRFRKTG